VLRKGPKYRWLVNCVGKKFSSAKYNIGFNHQDLILSLLFISIAGVDERTYKSKTKLEGAGAIVRNKNQIH
jgi:hypothetical protein